MRGLVCGSLLGLLACTHTPPVTVAQTSHDTLALAQDLEAQICFNVPDALHVPAGAAAAHCTGPDAAGLGLTDARHQQIAAALKTAFDLHLALTKAAASGQTVDWANFNAALTSAIAIIQQLVQAPVVVQLLQNVQGAKK